MGKVVRLPAVVGSAVVVELTRFVGSGVSSIALGKRFS